MYTSVLKYTRCNRFIRLEQCEESYMRGNREKRKRKIIRKKKKSTSKNSKSLQQKICNTLKKGRRLNENENNERVHISSFLPLYKNIIFEK